MSPVQKSVALVRGGSGVTQRTPLFMAEEVMRSASPSLSAPGSLPSFFFQPKLALVEERDCLGKDVKRICLVAHQLFQQSIKYNGEGREVSLYLTFFFFFFLRTWTELHLKP